MHNILIIDDDIITCQMVCRALRKKGMKVSAAIGPREADPLLKEGKFDPIILDVVMPAIDACFISTSIANTRT